MSKDTGGPAFPRLFDNNHENYTGMTLRDYFAAKAMQGNIAGWPNDQLFNPDGIAEHAYTIADAMLKEREK